MDAVEYLIETANRYVSTLDNEYEYAMALLKVAEVRILNQQYKMLEEFVSSIQRNGLPVEDIHK